MIFYRFLQCLLIPLMIGRAVWAVLRGHEDRTDLRDRLLGPSTQGPTIWIHGASVGELASARDIIAALHRATGHTILVTATRKTAVTTVRDWDMQGVVAGLAPLDLGWVTSRLIRRNRITRLIVLENELWPARMLTCHRMGIPVVLLSARMSDRSARLWARFPRFAKSLLAPVVKVIPQDQTSARNLIDLGAPKDRVQPVVKLKSGYKATSVTIPTAFADWTRHDTVLAAATHAGEDIIVLQAFAMAREKRPDLRLILAPRHATRGDEVAKLIAAAGHDVRRRSLGNAPDGPVYLADTLGDMPLWYTLAGVAFIGGSLVPKGGHTPYEPAAHGCAILHGPHLRNFAEDYAALHDAKAAVAVSDAMTLAAGYAMDGQESARALRAKNVAQPTDIKTLISNIMSH